MQCMWSAKNVCNEEERHHAVNESDVKRKGEAPMDELLKPWISQEISRKKC